MRTIVERMLPSQFLLDLGVYMQTAAHIELAVWQVTLHIEGFDPHSAKKHPNYVSLKLNTQELLRRFRGCGGVCPQALAHLIHDVAERVAEGIETRNLAAHGAFFWDSETEGTLGAAHYFARGRGGDRQFLEVQQTFSRATVDETIQVANQLLHDVIALREQVIEWRYPNGLPEPSVLSAQADADADPASR